MTLTPVQRLEAQLIEIPIEAYVDEEHHLNGHAADPERAMTTPPLDWTALANRTPPDRDWAIDHWLGMGHVTLLAGPGGIGKTAVAQAMGSCLTLQREYLDWSPAPRRVLLWATEDDENELWRRQVAIAQWLDVPLTDFSGKFFAHSYCGAQVELAGLVQQHSLVATPMMEQLRQQIGDYKADVIMLDNIARLYAGNENDRHQVTSFVAMLTAVAQPMNAAVLLLGHPGKAIGSEYSGSTAWEGAVRSRLYLGATLPDQPASDDEAPPDDNIRYLCRRKANYSAKDWRRIHFRDGVMVPEAPQEFRSGKPTAADPEHAAGVVLRSVAKLSSMGEHGTSSKSSPNYLPKLATRYQLLDGLTTKQFVHSMCLLQLSGQIVTSDVGQYANRTRKRGLTLAKKLP